MHVFEIVIVLLLLGAALERRRLSALRADGTIGDHAFHKVEEELDRAELSAEAMDPED